MTATSRHSQKHRKRKGLILALSGALIAAPLVAAQAAEPELFELAPEITHTGTGQTGYEVTFKYYDPGASSVRIKGEWSFASAADIAEDPTNPNPRFGNTWLPGDIPIPSPLAGSAGNWPVTEMVKGDDDIWRYTTELPSGVFTYQFFKDCAASPGQVTGCTPEYDKANAPWSTEGTIENSSQVYVPSDPQFGTEDLSWQAPAEPAQQGELTHVTFDFPGHGNPADKNYASVYTPAGYDANRTPAYPTYYLNHGGGGNEMNWSTQGAANDILDNLIASGKMQPAVVVMTNNPAAGQNEVTGHLIPFIEQNFNVSPEASARAFTGLSGGGRVVQNIMYNDTDAFGYYGLWSVPNNTAAADDAGKEVNLKDTLGIHVGVGTQDLGGNAMGNTTAIQQLYDASGIKYNKFNVDGAHTWSYWRAALRDFLTTTAFRTTTVDLSIDGDTVTVTVKSATTNVAIPTGTVDLTLGGKEIAKDLPLTNGVATFTIPKGNEAGDLTATYNGDALYNGSAKTTAYAPAQIDPTPPTDKPELKFERHFGADRYGTSYEVNKAHYKAGQPLFIATGNTFPDALAAGAAASKVGGSLSLVSPTGFDKATLALFKEKTPSEVFIIGGTDSVSDQTKAQLETALGKSVKVSRVSGPDRYATAESIAKTFFADAKTVLVAAGQDFPDALSASAAGGVLDAPVILVKGDETLNTNTAKFLKDMKNTNHAYVIGGPNSVSNTAMTSLASIMKVDRVAGADRYGTSKHINELLDENVKDAVSDIWLVSGKEFPDAVVAGAQAGVSSARLFLVPGDCVGPWVQQAATASSSLKERTIHLAGGPALLSDSLLKLNACK